MTVDHDTQDTPADEAADDAATAEERVDSADTGAVSEPEKQHDGGLRKRLVPIVLAGLLVVSGAVTAWLYFAQYRTDQQTNDAVAHAVSKAANEGTVMLLSYAPDTLDRDFNNAKSRLTGDFLSYYTDFTSKVVTPAVKQKDVKTKAQVQHVAVSELHPESATALVFVNQVTTSKENPDGSFAGSSVKVGLTNIDGNWLISSFDPV